MGAGQYPPGPQPSSARLAQASDSVSPDVAATGAVPVVQALHFPPFALANGLDVLPPQREQAVRYLA